MAHSFVSFQRVTLSILAIAYPSAVSHASAPIKRVVVVGGTHGNEYSGVWCIKALNHQQDDIRAKYSTLDISTLLANPAAHLANKRFIHSDLNREFTREKLLQRVDDDGLPKTIESLRAREIDEILGPKFSDQHGTDLVVDLHSTTSNMGITVIIPEGDELMAQAAAYVIYKCGKGQDGHPARCLMHALPSREERPNLSSTARHGFTIEVGPVPQGVLRHDAVEKTQRALHALLEFLHRRNSGDDVMTKLRAMYPTNRVPCYRSAPARRPGEMSGKITWPSDPENPNFPAVMVHKSLQDRDFHLVRIGDPLFVALDGSVISYDGSHGDEVYLIFVNEGGYYYESSGTGMSVAVAAHFDLDTGTMEADDETGQCFAPRTSNHEHSTKN